MENLTTDHTSGGMAAHESLQRVLLEQQAIFDNACIGILFAKSGRVQRCNVQAAHILGYEPDEIVGMRGIQIHPSASSYAELYAQARAALAAGKPFTTETPLKRKDGSPVWCRLRAKEVDPGHADRGTIWIVEDIGERREAEQRWRKTLREMEAIMMNASVGILFVRSGRIARHNRRLAELFGYSDEAIAGRSVTLLFHSREQFASTRHCALASLAVGKPIQTELALRRADGSSFWAQLIGYTVNSADTSEGTVWIIEDRSAQKAAEESLRATLMENQAIVENAMIGIAFLDQRRLLRCNRRLEEIFGYEPGEMIGHTTRLWYFTDEDYTGVGAAAYDDLEAGEDHVREQLLRRKGGGAFWARLSGRAIDPARPREKSLWLIEDITRRKRSEDVLHETTALQRAILDSASYAIIATNSEGVVRTFNQAAQTMLGYQAADVIGKARLELFHDPLELLEQGLAGPEADGALRALDGEGLLERARQGQADEREWTYVRKDGSRFPVQVTVTALHQGSGEITGFLAIASDITERKKAQEALLRARDELERRVQDRTAELAGTNARLQAEIIERRHIEERVRYMAHHDSLTGLPNRTLLKDRMEQAIALGRRYNKQVAVMFIDLDRFKTINDTLGHHVGDTLLKETGRRLRQCVRASDTVARLGGDEFVVVLPELGSAEEAVPIAEKLSASLEPPVYVDGHELHVTPSIGVCIFPRDGEDVETIMRNADTAMYQAKAAGRNNFQFYTEQMNAQATHHFLLESDLRRALGTGEFQLYFQPIIDLASGRLCAMEVLLRWQHPRQGLLTPASFIGIAEESGMIVQLGEWVLKQSCLQNKAWLECGLPVVPLAVNLSPRQFRQRGLYEAIDAALEESGLPASLLEVEITESTLMHQGEQTVLTLERLKAMGVSLSIDDFGTGYSSLAYLKRFAVQKLKIDRSFIKDLASNRDDHAIISAVVALAHSLGLVVIAEGVEEPEQLALLKELHCGYAQGYHFSRPMDAGAAAQLLRHSADTRSTMT